MKNLVQSSFAFILLSISTGCLAQTSVQISKPNLEFRNNRIIISYQILNSTLQERFNIWIEATDTDGKRLKTNSLNGDFGENVIGGGTKQISWNYEADDIFLGVGIYVQVFGELIAPKKKPEKELKIVEQPVKEQSVESAANISTAGAVLRSIAFPGLGLSSINPGKPHWLKGVAGYSCIASAIAFNRVAVNNYDKYLLTSDVTELNDYYDKAVMQDNMSEIFAYAAIGIWVTDIVWTIVASSKLHNNHTYSHLKGFSLDTDFEPLVQAPMITLRYRF